MSAKSTLNLIHKVHYATYYNLASYESDTFWGGLKQVRLDIDKLLGAGFIRKLPSKKIERKPRFETFYALTREGLRCIGIDTRLYEDKSPRLDDLYHESAKVDIAVAFVRRYSVWYYVDIEYPTKKLADIKKPDIIITLKHKKTGKLYTFLVEIERKLYAARSFNETVAKMMRLKDFEKAGLSPDTRALFVFMKIDGSEPGREAQWRVQDKIDPIYLKEQDDEFEKLLDLAKNCPSNYLFANFYDFSNVHKAIWSKKTLQKTLLINA